MGRSKRHLRATRVTGGLAILLVIGTASGGTAPEQKSLSAPPERMLPKPPANAEMGFIVQHFATTYESNRDDCPDGLATMLRENLLATLPPAEQARLSKPENANEFRQVYAAYARGPDNIDICTHYERFDRPAQKTVQGSIAQGFNLDDESSGSGSPAGCAHKNFKSPTGETGIDNQHWRALGCMATWRGKDGLPPTSHQQFNSSLANGENAQVLVLRGVDSLVGDDDVQVIYANTQDRAILNPNGGFISGASYRVGETPGGPNVMRGRIANGVLEASTPRLRLRQIWYLGLGLRGQDLRGPRNTWDFRRVRLRLSFQSDGSLKGLMGAYQPLRDAMSVLSMGGVGTALAADFDCPSIHAAMRKMADGDRDPKTGQCTTISTTYELVAVPAFVVPAREEARKLQARRS